MLGLALGRGEVMTERQLCPEGDSDDGGVRDERVKGEWEGQRIVCRFGMGFRGKNTLSNY